MLRILLKEEQLSEGSAKTDIYQLGMVIYQVLFQTRPFSDMPAMTPKGKLMCVIIFDNLTGIANIVKHNRYLILNIISSEMLGA